MFGERENCAKYEIVGVRLRHIVVADVCVTFQIFLLIDGDRAHSERHGVGHPSTVAASVDAYSFP